MLAAGARRTVWLKNVSPPALLFEIESTPTPGTVSNSNRKKKEESRRERIPNCRKKIGPKQSQE